MPGRQGRAGRRGGTFDAFDMARRRATISGTIDATTLPRLSDRLADEGGGGALVSWRITGCTDPAEHPALELALDGSVPLVCQRCMQTFDWPIEQCTLVLLARDQRELGQLDAEEEHEVILAQAPLETTALVEDELLLTLPFSPRCGRAACTEDAMHAADVTRGPERESAFAVLAGLKRGAAKPTKR
jgi:DUF177 domain-containing protein